MAVNRDVIGEAETFDRADRCVLDMDSDDWDELLVTEIERQHANGRRVAVRADAAFAKPEIYEALETRGADFVRRDGRALDQGRQTGGPLDPAVLSPVPRERGPAAVERARLQPRESEAAARVTQRIDSWSLTSVQQRLVKTGGRLVKHARYYWLLLRALSDPTPVWAMLQRIWALPVPTG